LTRASQQPPSEQSDRSAGRAATHTITSADAATRLIIDEAVAKLDDDERPLIQLRFFEQRSQSAIAEEIATSQMQVSRLLSRLLIKMRTIIGAPQSLPTAS
jgi:RNA polymerase sigma-B factor